MLACLRASASLESVLDQVVDAAVHVIPQFAIEVPFQPVASPTEEIEKPRHGLCALVEDQPDRRRQLVPTRLFDAPAAGGPPA